MQPSLSCLTSHSWAGSGHVPRLLLLPACRLLARQGIVVSAGAWSGQLLQAATGDRGWGDAFKSRRGHLLQVEPPVGMPPLRRGLMEADYSKVID